MREPVVSAQLDALIAQLLGARVAPMGITSRVPVHASNALLDVPTALLQLRFVPVAPMDTTCKLQLLAKFVLQVVRVVSPQRIVQIAPMGTIMTRISAQHVLQNAATALQRQSVPVAVTGTIIYPMTAWHV